MRVALLIQLILVLLPPAISLSFIPANNISPLEFKKQQLDIYKNVTFTYVGVRPQLRSKTQAQERTVG